MYLVHKFGQCFVTAEFSSLSNFKCEKCSLNEVSSSLSTIIVITVVTVNHKLQIGFHFLFCPRDSREYF